MSEHEELVERVAKAIAEAENYEVATSGHYTLARAALNALSDELRHDPPKGCDWVALPTEYVDQVVAMPEAWSLTLADACRATVARRPKPEPRTERVPWWEAVGRTLPGGYRLGKIVQAYPDDLSPGGMYVEYDLPEQGTSCNPARYADGTVEVLAEDDQ